MRPLSRKQIKRALPSGKARFFIGGGERRPRYLMAAMESIVTIGTIEIVVTIKATTVSTAIASITAIESTETIASVKPYASVFSLA